MIHAMGVVKRLEPLAEELYSWAAGLGPTDDEVELTGAVNDLVDQIDYVVGLIRGDEEEDG
ncbi:MAG: hypothetical protein LBK54_01665 [Propionibacteriaceae bacterium]|jgi:hypothetical protein|nr:hypothetical protein [Propionibacteriaceae bacterium]